MKAALSAFVAGAVFAAGLAISGMTNPGNILGFLDLTGAWRPALALVMGGSIFVYAIGNYIIRKRAKPLFDSKFHLPASDKIDRNLILGAAIFGTGWGIGGFCPGPALTALGAGAHDAIVFVVFMLAGMWIFVRVNTN